jgi:hypothetical protein
MEQQSHMNPVPYLRVTLKLKDKATHWSTHTISLSESDAAVSTESLVDTVQSSLFTQLNLEVYCLV